MDRTSKIVLFVCLVIMALWMVWVGKQQKPPGQAAQQGSNAAPVAVSDTNAPLPNAERPLPPSAAPRHPLVGANAPAEQTSMLENADARYTFTSHGGGLKTIELLRYSETVSETNRFATLNQRAPVPVLSLFGDDIQGDGVFNLTKTGNGVRAEKVLTNGLAIIKDFVPGSNYLVSVTVRLENHSTQMLTLPAQEWAIGTATPLGPRDDGMAVGMMWFNGTNSQDTIGSSYFSSNGFACTQRTPPTEYKAGHSITWAAVHNQYFALAAMPSQDAQDVILRKVQLPRLTGKEAEEVAANAPPPLGYEAALVFPGLTLTNNQVLERTLTLYAGPKEYQTLARLNEKHPQLDLLMGFGGFFGFFAKALLLGMNWVHAALSVPYGLAIVVITVLIKLVFWPLTQASTRSMKRMQALQPQLKAIKEKYKDDPAKANRKTMEFMKEHKVNPLGGCLPMVIQIPVFFGFYTMIRSAIELHGASFLWVSDLSKPDTLLTIRGLDIIPFFGIPGVGLPINLLPLLMGGTMLWQSHLTPPSPGMDQTQAKIMRYMPLIFMVFLYNYGSGLTLYWTVNNLLSIAQTKLTKTLPEPGAAPAKAPALTPPQKKRK